MNLNPIVLSIPIFFVLIGIELVVERLSHKKLYRMPDAIANLAQFLSCDAAAYMSGTVIPCDGGAQNMLTPMITAAAQQAQTH